MSQSSAPFEIYHDSYDELPESPLNAAYMGRMPQDPPPVIARRGVGIVYEEPRPQPRRRRRTKQKRDPEIPLPFTLPPGHYRLNLPSPPLLVEGEYGGQRYMMENEESPIRLDRTYSVVNIEEQCEASLAPDVNFPGDNLKFSPLTQGEIDDILYDDGRSPLAEEELPSSARSPQFSGRRLLQFSPETDEEMSGAVYVSPARLRKAPVWNDLRFSPLTHEELLDAPIERGDLEAEKTLKAAWGSGNQDMSRSVEEMLAGSSSESSTEGIIPRSEEIRGAIPRPRAVEPFEVVVQRQREKIAALGIHPPDKVTTIRENHLQRLIQEYIEMLEVHRPPKPKLVIPKNPTRENPSDRLVWEYLERLEEYRRHHPMPPPRSPVLPPPHFSPPPAEPLPRPHFIRVSPTHMRPNQAAPLLPEPASPLGVPMEYLLPTVNPKIPNLHRNWRKIERSPLPRMKLPLTETLPPEYAFLDMPLYYPKGRVSMSGAVLEESLDESSVMDELDMSINESMVAQSSWISWRAGLRPPFLGTSLEQKAPHNVQKPIKTAASPEDNMKSEFLNTECMYYLALLNAHSPKVSDQETRNVVSKWVKKLFAPEYHVAINLQEKRNKYLLSLVICVVADDVIGIFLRPPPEGPLPDPEVVVYEFDDGCPGFIAAWQRDDLWDDMLAGLPDPGVLDQPCGLHPTNLLCPESGAAKAGLEGTRAGGGKDKDVAESALLDNEFRFLLYQAKSYASLLELPFERTTAASWLHALCSIANDSISVRAMTKRDIVGAESWPCPLKRGVRNEYIQALLSYLAEWRLDGPFVSLPPNYGEGGPLPTLKSAAMASAKPTANFSVDPTSPLADKFLSNQPLPQEGAFCFVALSGNALSSWLPDCKVPAGNEEDVVFESRKRSELMIESEVTGVES